MVFDVRKSEEIPELRSIFSSTRGMARFFFRGPPSRNHWCWCSPVIPCGGIMIFLKNLGGTPPFEFPKPEFPAVGIDRFTVDRVVFIELIDVSEIEA